MKKTYSDMTVNELRHVAAKAERRINERIEKVYQKHLYSPALTGYQNQRLAKPISRMNRSELYNTLYRQNELKGMQTSTLKGTYQYANETRKMLKNDYGISTNNTGVGKLFDLYDRIAERDPSVKGYKYETVKEISRQLKSGMTYDDILNNANRLAQDVYEEYEDDDYFEDFDEL